MTARHSRKSKKARAIALDSKVSEAFFHKTKLCKFFPQGACVKGTSCPFAHIQSELLIPPDLYRTRMCMAFIKAGKCKDGEHCKYAHSKVELRTGTVPCSLEAGLDDSMRNTSQASHSTEKELPSPCHAATPVISLQSLVDSRLSSPRRAATPVISLQDLPDLRLQPPSHDAAPVMSLHASPVISMQDLPAFPSHVAAPMISLQDLQDRRLQPPSHEAPPVISLQDLQDRSLQPPSHEALPVISLQDLQDPRLQPPSHEAPPVISLQDLQDPRLQPPSHEALPVMSLQDLQDPRLQPPSHDATPVISLQDLQDPRLQPPSHDAAPVMSMQGQQCFATGPSMLSPQASPNRSITSLISMQDQPCFATGLSLPPPTLPSASTPLMSMQDQQCFATGFGSHPCATPYTCLPGSFDGAHMMHDVDSLCMGRVNSISLVPSPSGYQGQNSRLELLVNAISPVLSPGSATPESHSIPPSTVHANAEIGSEEQQGDTGPTDEFLFLRKMASMKEQHAERQADSSSKFDMYLPQINEDLEHSGADFNKWSRQFSCPDFSTSDDESDGEEEILNNFSAQKFTRQVSAPAELYENAFLDLKDGSDPILHQCSGYAVSIKNTFLDFGRPQEIFGARKRRPSL